MNLLVITGAKPKVINLDAMVYAESRADYTQQEARKLTTVYFASGKVVDIEADMEEVLKAIQNGNQTYHLKEDGLYRCEAIHGTESGPNVT